MSTFQAEYISGIVRNLDVRSLSKLSIPKDMRIGLTIINYGNGNKIKHVTKMIIYCNCKFFCIFRKYGYIQPMALISIRNGTYTMAKDKALEIVLNNKTDFLFIPDPLNIIGINHNGFRFKQGIDSKINKKDEGKNRLINEYLDFNDCVDYYKYYTNKNNRNKKAWQNYSYFAINIETNPSFDCKKYIENYKKQRKETKQEENMIYNYYQDRQILKCEKQNDKNYCKIYEIESISMITALQINLNTTQFNILENCKKWLKAWCFETELIDINDKHNFIKIGLFKMPSIKNNESNRMIKQNEFVSLLNDINNLDNMELKNYVPKYIKNMIKSFKPKSNLNQTMNMNKDREESSDSHDDDHKMDIEQNIIGIIDADNDQIIYSDMEQDDLSIDLTQPQQTQTNDNVDQFICNLLYDVYDPDIDRYESFHSSKYLL